VIVQDSRASTQRHLFHGLTLPFPVKPDFPHKRRQYFVAKVTEILVSRKNMWGENSGVLLEFAEAIETQYPAST